MPRPPLISVVMPMRNAERFVQTAARSVLSQEGVRLELLVVDDGSTDSSRRRVETISDGRVRVLDGGGRGIAAALNTGLREARGEYVCRCDSDDLFPGGRLRRQLSLLEERPEFEAVCGQFATMDYAGRPLAEMDCGRHGAEITEELRGGHTRTSLCTYLIRTEAARAVGFRGQFVTAEDIDFALRLGERGRVWFDPAVVYFYRLHARSITHTQSAGRRTHYERLARQLQTDRLRGGTDLIMRGESLPPPPADHTRPGCPSAQTVGVLMGAAWRHRRDGRPLQALWTGVRACTHAPANLAGWKSLAALLVKRSTD
jgi:glycosyltransferase involved in cell wall biosynthesis